MRIGDLHPLGDGGALMRYAAGHAAATRERLVDLAAALLRREGAAALGVQSLARAAGVTHGGFYRHFASREALLAAAIDRAFALASTGVPPDDDPRRALRGFIRAYLSPAHAGAPESGCPLPTLAGEAQRLEGAAGERYRAGAARLCGRLAAMMAAAGVADPEATARSVLAELVGAVTLARVVPDEAERDAVLAASRSALLDRLGL